jgi:hypothetical protein
MWFKIKRLDDDFLFDDPIAFDHRDCLSPDRDPHAIYAKCFFGAIERIWQWRPERMVHDPSHPRNSLLTRIYIQEETGFVIEVRQIV